MDSNTQRVMVSVNRYLNEEGKPTCRGCVFFEMGTIADYCRYLRVDMYQYSSGVYDDAKRHPKANCPLWVVRIDGEKGGA